MMFFRALSFSGGATASSISRKMKSAALDGAFWIMVRFEPGTASSLSLKSQLAEMVDRVAHWSFLPGVCVVGTMIVGTCGAGFI